MKDRELSVLKLIITKEYCDTKTIVETLGFSTRTARYVIKNLREQLVQYGCDLLYSHKKGYFFTPAHYLKVELLIQEQEQSQGRCNDLKHRRNMLLGYFLMNKPIDIKKVADEKYTNIDTIKHDIQVITTEYNIEYQLNKNVCTGNMQSDLQVMVTYINYLVKEASIMSNYYSQNLAVIFGTKYRIEDLQIIIGKCEYLMATDIDKSQQIQIVWLSYFVYIRWLDAKKGMLQANLSITEVFKNSLSKETFKALKQVSEAMGYKHIDKQNVGIIEQTDRFFNQIETIYGLGIDYTSPQYEQVITHLQQISLRMTYHIKYVLSNTERIVRLYPYSFSLSQQLIAKVISSKQKFSRDEVAYLTKAIQELLFDTPKSKTILFINNHEDTSYYQTWITHQYTKNIHIIESKFEEYEDTLAHTNEIKLVLNFTNHRVNTNLPLMQIKQLPSLEQMNEIDRILKQHTSNEHFLNSFFNQRQLKVYLNQTSLNDVLDEAARELKHGRFINNDKRLVTECLKREKIASSYIGYNTMLVHPLKYPSNRNVIYLAICKKSIRVDGEAVHIIFICCFKAKIEFNISRLFEYILKMVENKKYNHSLINSQSEFDLLINLNQIIKML